jgi:hypothetical protein
MTKSVMKNKSLFLILAFVALIGLYSCTKDKTQLPATIDCTGISPLTNTYNLNIYPNITSNYCAIPACHAFGASGGGVSMADYASTVSAFKNSTVICAITNAGCERMPKTPPYLPDSLIKQMQCWQANGYPQ